jgi:hypothetical protein
MEVKRGSLRRKLTLQVFLPFLVGVLICLLCAMLPMYYQCTETVDWVVDKMTSDQNKVLKQISYQVAIESSALLQIPTNFMLIAANLIARYNSLELITKSDFFDINDAVNGKLFEEGAVECYGYDAQLNASYVNASWYVNPTLTNFSSLDVTSKQNYGRSTVFDSFMRPIAAVAKSVPESIQQVYIVYEADGMFYMNPVRKMEFFVNCTDCNPTNFYDARERPYFNASLKERDTGKAVLVPIYKFASEEYLGQTVCTSSNFTEMNFTTTCLDYNNNLLRDHLSSITMGGTTYSYAISVTSQVYTHPNLPIKATEIEDIEYYEMTMKNATSRETRYFKDHIVPLFLHCTTTVHASYHIKGELINIAISPIKVRLKLDESHEVSSTHVYSVGVAMKVSMLRSDIDDLESESTKIYLYEVVIFTVLSAVIMLLWLL